MHALPNKQSLLQMISYDLMIIRKGILVNFSKIQDIFKTEMTIEQSYFNKSVEFDKQWLELCHLLTVLI